MAKRVVFDLDDDELERYLALGYKEKHVGYEASKAFQEWLNRREARKKREIKEPVK